jgi:hypothetical protein
MNVFKMVLRFSLKFILSLLSSLRSGYLMYCTCTVRWYYHTWVVKHCITSQNTQYCSMHFILIMQVCLYDLFRFMFFNFIQTKASRYIHILLTLSTCKSKHICRKKLFDCQQYAFISRYNHFIFANIVRFPSTYVVIFLLLYG